MKYLRGPYVIGADATDLMGAPEGGRFVALDAPAANHYAFAVVVVQLSDADASTESSQRLQGTAQLLAAAPELFEAVRFLIEASAPMTEQQKECWGPLRAAYNKVLGVKS